MYVTKRTIQRRYKMNPLEFYRKESISAMNRIETASKKMMSEIAPELESSFFAASDKGDIKKVRSIHSKLCKLVDSLEMEN